jgi:hypothetical protein
VFCEDHVHIVLGEGLLSQKEPTTFGPPLFSLEAVSLMGKVLAKTILKEEKEKVEEFFGRLEKEVSKQKRIRGRFAKGTVLQKHNNGFCLGSSLGIWNEFTGGREKNCNFFTETLVGIVGMPLCRCSLIHYVTTPPSVFFNRFKKPPEWEGKFKVKEGLRILE